MIVHAAILIIEAGALITISASVNHMFAVADAAGAKAEEAVREARAAQGSAEEARRSEQDNRLRHAEAHERAEAQRDAAIAALGQG